MKLKYSVTVIQDVVINVDNNDLQRAKELAANEIKEDFKNAFSNNEKLELEFVEVVNG